MNVQINPDDCVGLGVCYGNGPNGCPSVFGRNTDGTAYVKNPSGAPCASTAQANCCPGAIIIT